MINISLVHAMLLRQKVAKEGAVAGKTDEGII